MAERMNGGLFSGAVRFCAAGDGHEKPDNYMFANDTMKMTSAEFFAAYASKQDPSA